MMKVEYQRKAQGAFLVLEEKLLYKEDFQMRMLKENEILGILSVEGRGLNEYSRYYYDIEDKVSLKAMYEKATIGYQDLLQLLGELLAAMQGVYNYMLNAGRILLQPEYIFYGNGQFGFCYYPCGKKKLCKEFHKLTEYLVRRIDYEDEQSIELAHELHKRTMEENYNVEHIIARLLKQAEKDDESDLSQEEEVLAFTEQPEVVREQVRDFGVFQKIFPGRKKKWGDWSELE